MRVASTLLPPAHREGEATASEREREREEREGEGEQAAAAQLGEEGAGDESARRIHLLITIIETGSENGSLIDVQRLSRSRIAAIPDRRVIHHPAIIPASASRARTRIDTIEHRRSAISHT